ncbi:MAG: 23S rRNA (guanosine(2251)-2'-O)-methyltransferase RlmB [Rhodothermales bacterium]
MADQTGIIAGRNPVREALERGERSIEKVYLAKGGGGRPLDVIRSLASAAGVPVQFVPPQKLNSLAPGVTHQGCVAIAAALEYAVLEEMLHAIAATPDDVRDTKPVLVVLDEITDPHNFGAILRSAVAVGAAGVIVPESNQAPLNTTTLKASAGMAPRIPVARVTNLSNALLQLKERGYWVAGLDGEAEETVWTLDWDRPLALVVGSEGKGLRPRVRETCDFLVSIPMRGPAESLNASVATGIALFAAVRDRV